MSYFTNINGTTAGTLIKQGAGNLRRVTINTKPGTSGVLTIYDNTAASGTKIATIDSFNAVIGSIDFDVPCSKGIFVTITAGSGTPDHTILWD